MRGYEYAKGEYVKLTDRRLRAAARCPAGTSSTSSAFVEAVEIDPVYYERSYYLAPDERAEKPYALLMKAMEKKGLTALATITIRNKEQLCAIRPKDGTIMLETLYYPDEVRATEVDPGGREGDRARARHGVHPDRAAPQAVRAGGVPRPLSRGAGRS